MITFEDLKIEEFYNALLNRGALGPTGMYRFLVIENHLVDGAMNLLLLERGLHSFKHKFVYVRGQITYISQLSLYEEVLLRLECDI